MLVLAAVSAALAAVAVAVAFLAVAMAVALAWMVAALLSTISLDPSGVLKKACLSVHSAVAFALAAETSAVLSDLIVRLSLTRMMLPAAVLVWSSVPLLLAINSLFSSVSSLFYCLAIAALVWLRTAGVVVLEAATLFNLTRSALITAI